MNRQLYMGGGIMDVVPREPALFGGIKRAVKKATNTVKKIVKSPIGKAATAYALTAGLGSLGAGKGLGSLGQLSTYAPSTVGANLGAAFFGTPVLAGDDLTGVGGTKGILNKLGLTSGFGIKELAPGFMKSGIAKGIGLAGLTTFLTKSFGMPKEEAESVLSDPGEKEKYLRLYYTNLNKNATDAEVEEFVRNNLAGGGRIGFDNGSPGIDRETIMDLLEQKEKFRDLDPNFIVPEPEQSPDATPIPEGMMINPLQTMEFRDSNRNGIEDRREGIYLERDFIPKKDPEEFELDKFRKYFEDTKEFREVPRKNEAKGTGDPQEGINSLKPLADEQARGGSTLTLMDGTEVFIPTGAYRNGTLADIIYSSTKGDLLREDILGKMLFSKGGRVDYAEGTDDEFPLGDPTAPVNPFGPKPIGPVLPNKMMASNIENDKILEALFEKYIDMGLSPKDAAEKAMEEFDKMSMMETEGRGLAAMGGRMNYGMGSEDKVDLQEMLNAEPPFDAKEYTGRGADYKKSPLAIPDDFLKKLIKYLRKNQADGGIMNRAGYALGGGDTASDNAMQAASVEGLPVRQNPKGIKELDLRDNGGFIPPVGIKEKEDDIPAMLSNNEFVFTADAVRGMGDGNVNVGAQRMYDMMKKLEAGGRV